MTPRQKLITEVWKEEYRALGVRLVELDEKRQDCGLTPEEMAECAAIKKASSQSMVKMLHELRDVRTA